MIILSLPYLNDDFIQEYSKNKLYKWKEFRLDYSENYNKFTTEYINENTIITIRDISEGGKNRTTFEEKIFYYNNIIAKFNCLVDCEIALYKIPVIPSSNLILSYHDFNAKINYKKIKYIINLSNSIPSKFLKIAISINNYSDLIRLKLFISYSNKPVLLAGMGTLGKLTRVLYHFFGSEGTYVGLKNFQTANKQLSTSEAELYGLKKINKNTKLGGLIGTEQVFESLGLTFYNKHFKENKLDAVYLPFIVNNFKDFWLWYNWMLMNYMFYGFSVTMPYKKRVELKIRNSFNNKQIEEQTTPVNLYLPFKKESYNTDVIAFKKAVQYLNITANDSILIFGSGGSAESALIALNNFKNLVISSRNKIKGNKLAKKYSIKFITKIQYKNFNVFINCTPLGLKSEDVFKITMLKLPNKVIDLPYGGKKTPLIQNCVKNNIPFVDGKLFWRWQAEKQLKEFLKYIK